MRGKLKEGVLIVLSGPSGAGKGSLRQRLGELYFDIHYGISMTTRPPRPGEVDGEHYYFVDQEEFFSLRDSGQLVEWAEVYGNYYGTPRQPMEDLLASGENVILEKDIQGAMTLKKKYPRAVYVFVLPPSMEELRQRIRQRGTESPKAIRQRLESASDELKYLGEYDYAIINDDLDQAAADLATIIKAEECRVSRLKLDRLIHS